MNKKSLYFLVLCALLGGLLNVAPSASAQQNNPDTAVWGVNGSVYAIETAGNRAYIGGSFTYVGPNLGTGIPVNLFTGKTMADFPEFNDEIKTVISDGSDGWYVGGSFTEIGGVAHQYLAHILSSGTLDSSWKPQPNDFVYSLALSPDGKIYAGGNFTQVNSTGRSYLASFDKNTGNLTSWNPGADGSVQSIVATNTVVYVGGSFTNIGGAARNYVAALSPTTGLATAWDPNSNATPFSMVLSSDETTLYAGGSFTNIGGAARNYVAALNNTDGSATSWDPNANSTVYDLALGSGLIYVGGSFTNIGGAARNYVAAIDLTTANASSFNPNPNSDVYSLEINGSLLYVAGNFTVLGGQTRNYLGAVNTTTGGVNSWDPNAGNYVNTLAINSAKNYIFAGGGFISIGGVNRNNLAEIDLSTGQATSWNPDADSTVYALALNPSNTVLYVGGDFSNISSVSRNRIAAFDTSSGAVTSWNPSADDSVMTLTVSPSGGIIYAGGYFSNIGGAARVHGAAISSGTGLANSWSPTLPYPVFSLTTDGSGETLYTGDYYIRCTPPRPRPLPIGIAVSITALPPGPIIPICTYAGNVRAINTSNGLSVWSTAANRGVSKIALSQDEQTIYAGGAFTNFSLTGRNYLAALETTTGNLTSWNPSPNANVSALLVDGDNVYVGGSFSTIGGSSRTFAALLSASGGSVLHWNPDLNSNVGAFAISNNAGKLLAGGDFYQSGNKITAGFAAYSGIPVTTKKIVDGGGLPVFAFNPPSPPEDGFAVSINNNAPETNLKNVTLYFRGGPDTKKMSVSNNPDFLNASQESYVSEKPWVLSDGEGIKNVYVKFFTQYGQSSEIISDSIVFKSGETTSNEVGAKTNSEENSQLPKEVSDLLIDCKFDTNISYGQSGNATTCLQRFLASQGAEIYPEGIVSGWFGPLTLKAVIRFQEKYSEEILKPLGLTRGTGFVGIATRAKINQLLGR